MRNVSLFGIKHGIYTSTIFTWLSKSRNKDKIKVKSDRKALIEGKNKETIEEDLQKKILSIPNATLVKEYINSGMDKKDAIKAVAKEKGIPKNEVYKDCLDL